MTFNDIIGQEAVKHHLTDEYERGKVPHALMLHGAEGCGALPLAVAYAQMYVTTAVPASGDSGVVNEQVASFDISQVWNKAETMSVRVHVNNTAGTQKVYEFKK